MKCPICNTSMVKEYDGSYYCDNSSCGQNNFDHEAHEDEWSREE